MSSLAREIEVLERDLAARPPRIAAHSDMPFAIFRYAPSEEYALRGALRLLAIRLEQEHGRRVTFVSLSRLVWDTVRRQGGVDYLFRTEAARGFAAAQRHVNRLLSSPDFEPIADALAAILQPLDPARDLAFLVRAGGFAPFVYRCSVLLEGLHRRTMVPLVLFYPGSAGPGTDLRFYDIPAQDAVGVYNYRVSVYGART
jgi:hypothetical protein